MTVSFTSVLGCKISVDSTEQEGLDHLPPGVMLSLDIDVRHAEVVLSHADVRLLIEALGGTP